MTINDSVVFFSSLIWFHVLVLVF